MSLLGFSLGALAAPAAQRLAAQHGVAIGWTVLACGGAPLGALVEAHPKVRARWFASALGHLADLVLWPVEPSAHLPHITGRFLVLEGRDDPLIPAHAAASLRGLTPRPKQVVAFDGGHMGIGPAHERLLNVIIAESRAWLIRNGAVSPLSAVPESRRAILPTQRTLRLRSIGPPRAPLGKPSAARRIQERGSGSDRISPNEGRYVMKLSSTQIQRATTQIGAQVILDCHPVADALKGIFGDHTFFLDGKGLELVESGEPTGGSSLANVVNLASWADEARTALVPHEPQVTDVIVEVGPKDSNSAA